MIQFTSDLIIHALPPSEVRAFGASQLYKLKEDFTYASDAFGPIRVHAGFVTDFASIPRFALAWMDDDAPEILFGSVLHDFVYSFGGILPERFFTRKEADELLREAMLVCGASKTQANIVYSSVRAFGGSHWEDTK